MWDHRACRRGRWGNQKSARDVAAASLVARSACLNERKWPRNCPNKHKITNTRTEKNNSPAVELRAPPPTEKPSSSAAAIDDVDAWAIRVLAAFVGRGDLECSSCWWSTLLTCSNSRSCSRRLGLGLSLSMLLLLLMLSSSLQGSLSRLLRPPGEKTSVLAVIGSTLTLLSSSHS